MGTERLTGGDPQFRSMKISHDTRAEAQKVGMAEMAETFREGGKLYVPVAPESTG